jgi:oxygen-dependent protoporphyrinogen oxidase
MPEVEVVLFERSKLGGKVLTRLFDGFRVEGGPDSFLSRKERGVGLCEELGLADELIGRRPENARSFVRLGRELHALPEGLTGMIPTDLERLRDTPLLSSAGRERLAEEVDVQPAPPGADESVASFVTRRLGREVYETLVEPLMTGIYGGDGEQLSLRATFPQLRELELTHGSVLRGLASQSTVSRYPVFVSLRSGMYKLVTTLARSLERTRIMGRMRVRTVQRLPGRYAVDLGSVVQADGVVLAVPAFVAGELLAPLDSELAELHAEIPYASSAVVTLGYRRQDVPHPLDGYGYVVPRTEGSNVLACTWTSSKWEGRAPADRVLLRVFCGRFERISDQNLVRLAREEVGLLGSSVEPLMTRIYRWPRGMPQYVLGHPERLERIDVALERHPGLALAGAAYRGVGIPDCIASGEHAAESVVRALTGAHA